MSNSQLRYIYGKMLKQVCEAVGVRPTKNNKEVVKAMLKRASNIDSLGRYKDDDAFTHNVRLLKFITHSAMLLASEFAMVIDLPGEENAEQMDMKSFLELIYPHKHNEDETNTGTGEDNKTR